MTARPERGRVKTVERHYRIDVLDDSDYTTPTIVTGSYLVIKLKAASLLMSALRAQWKA
jgi:hypothetical protein